MTLIQVEEVAQQLARNFDISGPQVIDVITTISPVLDVGAQAQPPYGTTIEYSMGLVLSADATHTGYFGLLNPSDSREWYVLDNITAGCTVNATMNLVMLYATGTNIENLPNFAPLLPILPLDGRLIQKVGGATGQNTPVRGFSQTTLNGSGITNSQVVAIFTVPPFVTTRVPIEKVVVPPNTACYLFPSANNLTWVGNFNLRTFEVRQK